jgi:hypothetical protein
MVMPIPYQMTNAPSLKPQFLPVDSIVANVVNVGPNAAAGFDAVDLGEVLGRGRF